MKLTLTRKWFHPTCTIGTLDIDGHAECYILEDVERDEKVPGETAIPLGVYVVVIDYSERFKRRLPRLLDVPGFTGVRIHPGKPRRRDAGLAELPCLPPLDPKVRRRDEQRAPGPRRRARRTIWRRRREMSARRGSLRRCDGRFRRRRTPSTSRCRGRSRSAPWPCS